MYKEYRDLLSELSLLEAKKEALREKILAELKSQNKEVEVVDNLTFSVNKTTKWKYTAEVDRLSDKVKMRQDIEKKKGIAKSTVIEYLKVTTNI